MIDLNTSRLVLRAPTRDDLEDYLDLNADPRVVRFVGTTLPAHPEETVAWIEGLAIRFPTGSRRGVWVAEYEGEFAGSFMLRPARDTGELELGYRLRPALWGRGLATEASRALLNLADGIRVVARIHRDNLASRYVAERIGLALVREYEWNGRPSVEYATGSPSPEDL